ncbi:MAG: mannose-6-phosphate isomerase, class I, partial [Bacteroidota bacterium]
EVLQPDPNSLTKNDPAYWAWRAFEQYSVAGQHDRGIFSIYWFNLVNLRPGQGIFQGAGIPHAYLEGVNVELMANSDNVLRGGLTPKHIDVPELLANIKLDEVVPELLEGQVLADGRINYPVPVSDFAIDRIDLLATQSIDIEQSGPTIYLVLDGQVTLDGQLWKRGSAFFSPDGAHLVLENRDHRMATLYRAYVDTNKLG